MSIHSGVLQNFARKYKTPIDKLGFEFAMVKLSENDASVAKPTDGAYIHVSSVLTVFLCGEIWLLPFSIKSQTLLVDGQLTERTMLKLFSISYRSLLVLQRCGRITRSSDHH